MLFQDAEFAVEEGSSVANMLTPRHAAKIQVANVNAFINPSSLSWTTFENAPLVILKIYPKAVLWR